MALGGNWRMPTVAEQDELRNNCTCEWTELNGVSGMKGTSKVSGFTDKWIFLPAAGYWDGTSFINAGNGGDYWSSSLRWQNPAAGYYGLFNSAYWDWIISGRHFGYSVRPVCE